MRVAIANPTAGGISGGYQKYLNRLVPAIAADARLSALRVFVPAAVTGRLQENLPLESVSAGEWSRRVGDFKPDVLFVPTARVLRVAGVPRVTMLRNMEPLTVPFGGNSVGESLRNIARAIVAFRACRSADRVIAVSDYVREFLHERWRVPDDRIGVVRHGVDAPAPPSSWRQPARLSDPHGPFLFTAGSIRPARGLRTAIAAFADVASRHPQLRLLIAGDPTPDSAAHVRRLHQQSERLGVAPRIEWLGGLGTDEMSWCYGHAIAFLMASRAEACPNIALEALSHGCVVVSTPRPPMPEFFGDAAVYADRIDDAMSLAGAMDVVLRAPEQHARLQELARQRASRYTWEAAAKLTIDELGRARAARPVRGRAA
jgi:glycosyltransferase involved in cell wall biosynthesis